MEIQDLFYVIAKLSSQNVIARNTAHCGLAIQFFKVINLFSTVSDEAFEGNTKLSLVETKGKLI